MILVDANIPMYLVGAPHPHKIDAQRLLERAVAERQRLVTDAEVFQEILHRYTAIGRRDAIGPAFEVLRSVVDEILPVDWQAVNRARELVLAHVTMSARDALHVAVMEHRGIGVVMSFDKGFDGVPGITRFA